MKSLPLALGSFLLAACASFAGEELQPLRAAELEGQPLLPAVTYTLKTYGSSSLATSGDPRSRIEPLFRRAFVDVRELTAEDAAAQAGELHLDILLRQTPRNAGLTIGLGILWLSSLGLFPAYGRDDLYLDVRVLREGQPAAHHVYTEHLSTWLSVVLLPWSFTRDPEQVHAEVVDTMVLYFLRDLRHDLAGASR